MLFGLFLSLLATVSYVASVTISPHVRHEHRRSIPDGWNLVRRAPPTTVLPLKVGLVQPNLDQLEKHLLDVSHPDSPNYGQHWSPAKIAQTFRPSKDSVDTVLQWLTWEGIDASRINLSKTGGWVEANVSVTEAEALLKTQYSVYEHAATGAEHLACGSAYHLPEHVSSHVELVTPTLHFDVKFKREPVDVLVKRSAQTKPGIAKSIGQPGAGVVTPKTTGKVKVSGTCAHPDSSEPLMNPFQGLLQGLSQCDQFITPDCLRALYSFVYEPIAAKKNSFGIGTCITVLQMSHQLTAIVTQLSIRPRRISRRT